MIELTYEQLNSEGFNQGLKQLSQAQGFSTFQAAYNVSRIVRQFHKELAIARELYGKWISEYVVKTEDGKYKVAEEGKQNPFCPWEIKEDKLNEFKEKMADFLKTKVQLESNLISPEELGTVKLSPQQILVLGPIFSID